MRIVRYFIVMMAVICMIGFGGNVYASSFKDVKPSDPSYPAIQEMVDKGIASGFPDGTFRQNASITRGQAAIFISRALKIDVDRSFQVSFKDVPKTSGEYPYIAALVERGVLARAEYFYPQRTLSREEMAKILVEAFSLEGVSGSSFVDVPKSSWSAVYVDKLAGSGVTTGVGQNRFNPKGQVTRGQMAMFITRALNSGSKPKSLTVQKPVIAPVTIAQATAVEQAIFHQTNDARKQARLPALKWANDLSGLARLKSEDMLTRNYFDHQSPTYGRPAEMMKQFGIDYAVMGENIARGYGGSADRVMDGWLNSAGHKENIMNRDVDEIGIGVVQGEGANDYYYTQLFLKRR